MGSNDWISGVRTRLTAFTTGEAQVAPTRDAATVVIVRDGVEGLEVFLMERAPSMAFAAGAHVFPGGKVDPTDSDFVHVLPTGWTSHLGARDDAHALAIVGCAIRETIEEVGVRLEPGQIFPWAHWITPEVEPRRFDTRFLVAALPDGQDVVEAGTESVGGRWWTPADALAACYSGSMFMLPPTIATLEELKAFESARDVMAHAAEREVRTVLPRLAIRDDELVILHIGDEGYDEAALS